MRYIKPAVVSVFLILVIAVAVSGTMISPISDTGKEHSQAPEHSPVIDENSDIMRTDFIHYATPPSPGKPDKSGRCYRFMGATWNGDDLPINYTINTTTDDVTAEDLASAISNGSMAWDSGTSVVLFDTVIINDSAQYGIQDFENVIQFRPLNNDRVIAVTTVWWFPQSRRIIEFDMLFNDYWDWGNASEESNVMDVWSIAAHEMGHAIGLDDLYGKPCKEVTMYGYSDRNETKKRTLEPPDIDGLHQLYGE